MAWWYARSAFYPQLEVSVFSAFDLIKPYGKEVKLEQEDRCSPYQICWGHLEAHPLGLQKDRAQEECWSLWGGSKWGQTRDPLCLGQLSHMRSMPPAVPFLAPVPSLIFINCRLTRQIIQLGCRWVPRRWIIMFNGDLLTLADPGNITSCKVVFPSPLLFMDVVKGPTPSLLQERPLLQPAQSLHWLSCKGVSLAQEPSALGRQLLGGNLSALGMSCLNKVFWGSWPAR